MGAFQANWKTFHGILVRKEESLGKGWGDMAKIMSERKKRPLWFRVIRLLVRWALALTVLALLAGAGGFYYVYDKYGRDLPDISILEDYRPAETTKILASDGTVIATLYQENRVWAPLDKVSPWVVPALLATEDSRYFDHLGVDPVGIARVLFNTAVTGEVREGASTITMQLARNVFPLSEVNWERKIKEIFLSLEIDRRYSKEKVLELYLNQVYFGAGAHGIHSAAQVYFQKGPSGLTLSEAALIAGLIQAPSRFNPLDSPERAFHRQDEVLARMLAVNAITQAQMDEALAERETWKFDLVSDKRSLAMDRYPYFTSFVIKELSARYSEDQLYRGGLTIVTTLDRKLQDFAQKVLTEEVKALSYELRVDSGALVMLENDNGYIKSMVGGLGWSKKNQFNRAYQTRRQPGSSFKPATYGAALEAGFTPDSKINDQKVTYQDGSVGGWTPKNSDGRFLGLITFREALRGSRNVPAVKILNGVGVEKVIDLGYRMGIRAPIPANLSIALGAVDASPLEMAEFYSVIANKGNRITPTAIKVVKKSDGEVLEDRRRTSGRRVLSEQTALGLISMLSGVVNAGTGTNAQVAGWQIAGKTGTTDSFRDAWFCGISPYFTLTVWVGNDDNSPMYRSYGGDLPATVFRRLMTFALKDKKKREFPAYKTPASSPDLLNKSEVPAPSPSALPEEFEEDIELVDDTLDEVLDDETTEFEPPDGKSYLLPDTLETEPGPEPAFTPEPPEPHASADPMPIVTPAPLPDDFSSEGGISEDESQYVEQNSQAPPATEVSLPPE
jgi:penicillin-binding protein 1A